MSDEYRSAKYNHCDRKRLEFQNLVLELHRIKGLFGCDDRCAMKMKVSGTIYRRK